jgi:hypothetical protein
MFTLCLHHRYVGFPWSIPTYSPASMLFDYRNVQHHIWIHFFFIRNVPKWQNNLSLILPARFLPVLDLNFELCRNLKGQKFALCEVFSQWQKQLADTLYNIGLRCHTHAGVFVRAATRTKMKLVWMKISVTRNGNHCSQVHTSSSLR